MGSASCKGQDPEDSRDRDSDKEEESVPPQYATTEKGERFEVFLAGYWKDFGVTEDKILKCAYLSGFPNVQFELRKQKYTYNFVKGEDGKGLQWNDHSGKSRRIHPPVGWEQPRSPLPALISNQESKDGNVPTVIRHVKDTTRNTVQFDHPLVPDAKIIVTIPPGARPGQVMLVPVPAEKANLTVDGALIQAAPDADYWQDTQNVIEKSMEYKEVETKKGSDKVWDYKGSHFPDTMKKWAWDSGEYDEDELGQFQDFIMYLFVGEKE